MSGERAMSMFARLLDRSVERIRELTTDPRDFDRHAAADIASAWVSNAGHLLAAANLRPGRLRDLAAAWSLRWMADLGPERRAWMAELGGAGLDGLLPEAAAPLHRPLPVRETGCDLGDARLRSVEIERCGRRLGARLTLTTPRRYAQGEAILHLNLSGLHYAVLDVGDTHGVVVRPGHVGVGAQGVLEAAEVTVHPDDRFRDPPAAGREAGAAVGRTRSGETRYPWVPVWGDAESEISWRGPGR